MYQQKCISNGWYEIGLTWLDLDIGN